MLLFHYIGEMVSLDARTPLGKTIAYLRHKYNVNFDFNLSSNIDRIVKEQLWWTIYVWIDYNHVNPE